MSKKKNFKVKSITVTGEIHTKGIDVGLFLDGVKQGDWFILAKDKNGENKTLTICNSEDPNVLALKMNEQRLKILQLSEETNDEIWNWV